MIYFEKIQVSPCSRIHLKKLVYLKLQFVQRKNFRMRDEGPLRCAKELGCDNPKAAPRDAGSFISFFLRARRQCLLENRSKKSDMSIDFLKSAAMKQTPFLFLGM